MSKRRRPPFIITSGNVPENRHQYPNSDEFNGYERGIGRAAGLLKIGVNLMRLPPGERSSWPHAEEKEEEFVYVLQGEVDAWVDGALYPMTPGDLAAFPSGTGISHCFINNSAREVLLLVGGEASRRHSRIYYPLHPQRRNDMPWSAWWDDVPARRMGAHDGMPDAMRAKASAKRRGSRAAS
ncbi:MAG TPA: cupin domain-containing protein [Candidatus Binataceae bacterium]|nr:cupin domain-containing protein [Candidatus Binataceae bacterium]